MTKLRKLLRKKKAPLTLPLFELDNIVDLA